MFAYIDELLMHRPQGFSLRFEVARTIVVMAGTKKWEQSRHLEMQCQVGLV